MSAAVLEMMGIIYGSQLLSSVERELMSKVSLGGFIVISPVVLLRKCCAV